MRGYSWCLSTFKNNKSRSRALRLCSVVPSYFFWVDRPVGVGLGALRRYVVCLVGGAASSMCCPRRRWATRFVDVLSTFSTAHPSRQWAGSSMCRPRRRSAVRIDDVCPRRQCAVPAFVSSMGCPPRRRGVRVANALFACSCCRWAARFVDVLSTSSMCCSRRRCAARFVDVLTALLMSMSSGGGWASPVHGVFTTPACGVGLRSGSFILAGFATLRLVYGSQ